MTMKSDLCFASADFDRQALKRSDGNWISNRLGHEDSLFLIYWDNKFLTEVDSSLKFLDKTEAAQFDKSPINWSYLGELAEGKSVFATEIFQATEVCTHASWKSLRSLGLFMSAEIANLLALAQGLLIWQSHNNYCSLCAFKLESRQAGHALVCSNPDCAKEIFPRTDPAIIVHIYHQDACLLGRSAIWPEKMYSCLAGFVETGESFDGAVRREVFEESGLAVKNIEYRASQPWPLPQSLMIGFHAEAKSRELTFHDGEIHDARWLTRQGLLDALEKGEILLSSSLSISYHLIEDWFNQLSDQPLSDLVKKYRHD